MMASLPGISGGMDREIAGRPARSTIVELAAASGRRIWPHYRGPPGLLRQNRPRPTLSRSRQRSKRRWSPVLGDEEACL